MDADQYCMFGRPTCRCCHLGLIRNALWEKHQGQVERSLLSEDEGICHRQVQGLSASTLRSCTSHENVELWKHGTGVLCKERDGRQLEG